ncbi:MAG: DUF1592 domain-containing protein [Acidobacteriota bacterium]|nr:DUF1592 domain-containing protein [Acidobacteriota bacterium]
MYPVLQKAGCPSCHSSDGVASGTRLHFPEADAAPSQVNRFGKSLALLVDRKAPDQSLLLNKPTRRMPHAGGKRITPGSPEEAVLRRWMNYLVTLPPAETVATNTDLEAPTVKTVPVLRRLTHAQYNNTVRDLLGDDSRIADQFPPEDFVNGFKDQFQSQSISPLLAESYSMAAEKLARNAFRGGDTHHLIPCKAATPADAECRDKFVRGFGKHAFRRPMTADEVNRYGRLFTSEAAGQRSFLAGAKIVVEAMLQSPAFLTRAENGAVPQWTAYETASRLSYFLWNTMPDAALVQSAESGELNSASGIEHVARGMLKDPRSRSAVDEFISQWLRFDRVLGMVKERRLFPNYTPELAIAMAEEPRRLASDLVWSNGDFRKLFSADYTFVNSDLAALYQLPAPATEFGRVALPEKSGRAGIAGQALFLASTSKPEETSPTARGLFVREQFLCQEVPPPPPGVNTNLPALTKARPKTNRERLASHTTNETCASCHSLIDPIGFGLEKYDAIGQRRENLKITFLPGHGDKGEKTETVELDLDSDGFIAGIPNSKFTTPRELGLVLAQSRQCQECIVKQLFRYAAGRRETPNDRRVIEKAYDQFKESQFHFQELMVSLIRLMVFPPTGKESNVLSSN